jgi:hypothetical protein
MENNSIVVRVDMVSVRKPFNGIAVDFDITEERCSANPHTGCGEIRSAVLVGNAGKVDHKGATVCRGEHLPGKELVHPYIAKKRLRSIFLDTG